MTHTSNHAPALDGSLLARFIGRATLYTVTCFLVTAGLAVVSSTLWLCTPLANATGMMAIHRAILSIVLILAALSFVILFILHRLLVPPRDLHDKPLQRDAVVHVGLTAYNDEQSIGDAVREFRSCPDVDRVIVVDNNSTDHTSQVARDAGADEVVVETDPGYGACCMRAMAQAAEGADVIILCEGDMTFSAGDVKKFLAYLENCDLVLGTRATQELRATDTQMDWLINPANQIVAKLVQTRFWGTRLTDMGCTYRAIRIQAYHHLKDRLTVKGNHFSPHMFIEALKLRMRVVEIPVVFRKRVGLSKGVGHNKLKAARVAMSMLGLIYRA